MRSCHYLGLKSNGFTDKSIGRISWHWRNFSDFESLFRPGIVVPLDVSAFNLGTNNSFDSE
jgi:hypothetical protein